MKIIDRSKIFTRRAALLGGLKGSMLTLLLGRMYYLQVVESDKYAVLADENRISTKLLVPARGLILDRFGKPLALNTENFSLTLVKEQVRDINQTLDSLSKIIHISALERQRILRDLDRYYSFVPVKIKDHLTWSQVAAIEVNSSDLYGVDIDTGRSRIYPQSSYLSHITGYVAHVDESVEKKDPLLNLPGFKVGRSGIERQYENILRGQSGASHMEVNSLGRSIRELKRQESISGQTLSLTVDSRLQRYCYQCLSSTISSSAVVLDCRRGDVLAMASYPSYDANKFVTGISVKEWNSFVNNPQSPLRNKTVSGVYPPASTFKMLVALAALEAGILPSHRVQCTGSMTFANHRFHCWKSWGHGSVSLHKAIEQSCDIWFYEVSRKVGINRIADMAKRLGLGYRTGIDLPSESTGQVPTKAWKLKEFGKSWLIGETLICSIGQGYVEVTPLQLAVMTARLASGLKIQPHLAMNQWHQEKGGSDEQLQIPSLDIDPYHLKLIRQAMYSVVNHPNGSAYKSMLSRRHGGPMAGKTGTAQVKRISTKERLLGVRKNEDKKWKDRDHALFVAYAPYHNPQYTVSVIVEHGGSGAKSAAPIARQILEKAHQLNSSKVRR